MSVCWCNSLDASSRLYGLLDTSNVHRQSQLVAFSGFQGVESTIPLQSGGVIAGAAAPTPRARVDVTQAPPQQALSPQVSFNVINRWGAKIEWRET